MSVLVSFFRETETTVCVFIYKKIYFKELAHLIMDSGKSKIFRVHLKAGDQGRANSSQKAICWQNSLLLRRSVFGVI